MPDSSPALVLDNLCCSYQSHWTFRRQGGVRDISLEVEQGEVFGFLGHNGAGKTSTIKAILNLVKKDKGEIRVFGKDPQKTVAREKIGYVPEQPYFYDHLNVEELLLFFAALKNITGREGLREKDRVSELLKIDEFRKRKLKTLSKGQIQRVAMAQALIGGPQLLLLDEPFSGLDPLGRKEFADLILGLKKEGKTVFISSHILSDIEFLCDRAAILKKGRLAGIFDLKEYLRSASQGVFEMIVAADVSIQSRLEELSVELRDGNNFFICTFDDKEKAQAALSLAVESRIEVESFGLVYEGLEELFIRVVKDEEED